MQWLIAVAMCRQNPLEERRVRILSSGSRCQVEARIARSAGERKRPDEEEPQMPDGNITDHAVATIERMANGTFGADVANGSRPFFLAVGLHKPHTPWHCPSRFWDLYPLANVPSVPHTTLPGPAISGQDWQMRSNCNSKDVKERGFCDTMSDGRPMTKRYPLDGTAMSAAADAYQRQAYFACVSWTDANIGRVLDAFEKTQFGANDWNGTVVVLWGDHGYHLGDNDLWEKVSAALFSRAARVDTAGTVRVER